MARFEEIVPGILRLKVPFGAGWTAVTLIRGEENCLIDAAGCAANVDDTIVPALKAEGLRMDDIACVLLTHMHGDHVGGVARMKELNPALKAAVFRDSLERMREPRVYSRKIRSVYPAYSAPVPEVLEGCEPDILLGDGEGWGPLALIHTPGHDTDSCCWWHIPTGTLICGDSLQQRGTASQGCALLMDVPEYRESVARLMTIRVKNIVLGHAYLPLGDVFRGEEACRKLLVSCLCQDAADRAFVRGMAAAGVRDDVTIARELIRECGGKEPKYLFLPLYTVNGYYHETEREER